MDIRETLSSILHVGNKVIIDELARISHIRMLKKGDVLLRVGQTQTNIILLLTGVVRCFYTDEAGAEITDCFVSQRGFPVLLGSFSHPSLVSGEAVTESSVLEMDVEKVFALMERFPELVWEYVRLLQYALLFHWRIGKVCTHYRANQRYAWFLKNWPGVDKLAKNAHVASFLGITPETLSRMRHTIQLTDPGLDPIICEAQGWSLARIRDALSRKEEL